MCNLCVVLCVTCVLLCVSCDLCERFCVNFNARMRVFHVWKIKKWVVPK